MDEFLNDGPFLTITFALLSSIGTLILTMYRQRNSGPEMQEVLSGATDLLIHQLSRRIEVLEARLEIVERDNAKYRARFGAIDWNE